MYINKPSILVSVNLYQSTGQERQPEEYKQGIKNCKVWDDQTKSWLPYIGSVLTVKFDCSDGSVVYHDFLLEAQGNEHKVKLLKNFVGATSCEVDSFNSFSIPEWGIAFKLGTELFVRVKEREYNGKTYYDLVGIGKSVEELQPPMVPAVKVSPRANPFKALLPAANAKPAPAKPVSQPATVQHVQKSSHDIVMKGAAGAIPSDSEVADDGFEIPF